MNNRVGLGLPNNFILVLVQFHQRIPIALPALRALRWRLVLVHADPHVPAAFEAAIPARRFDGNGLRLVHFAHTS